MFRQGNNQSISFEKDWRNEERQGMIFPRGK